MPLSFAFSTSSEILFGGDGIGRGVERAVASGRRILLVTGARSLEGSGVLDVILDRLDDLGAEVTRWAVPSEPDISLVDAGAAACREAGCTAILAVGGGSVIDTAKAVGGLAANGGRALDYLEDVGDLGGGRHLIARALPVVAMPTTAGSGSEVTRNSVLRVPELSVKRSMRSDLLLPAAAVVDPALSAGAPVNVAAAAGLDALTHLIEAYISRRAQPMTDALAVSGIRMAVDALRALAHGSADTASAERMAVASLFGGMALANAGLGAVHGLVAPLGGRFPVPHGAGCACLLPHAITTNHRALAERMPGHQALSRYEEIAAIVHGVDRGSGTTRTSIERAADVLEELRRNLGVPPLATFGVAESDVEAMVAASRGGSMRANPIDLTDEELSTILHAALATN
jgi:alcohol dehydrogenase class IV